LHTACAVDRDEEVETIGAAMEFKSHGKEHEMKGWHMVVCLGLVAGGVALVAAGVGTLAFVPIIGCALMMGMMVWMIARPGGGDGHGG